MIILSVVLAIFFFFGWSVLRKFFNISDTWFLIGASEVFGMIVFVIIANTLAYAVGTPRSFHYSLATMVFILIPLFFLKNKTNRNQIKVRHFSVLLALIGLIGYVYAANYLYYFQYDEGFHLPLSQTIASGNFPVKSLYFPEHYIQYHYGYDFLTAGLSSLSGIPVWWTSDAVLILCIISTFVLSYSFFFVLTQNYHTSLLCAFLFFFGGGLNYLSVFTKINLNSQLLWEWITKIVTELLNQPGFSMGYFHASSMASFADGGSYHHPTTFSIPAVLILFYLFIKEQSGKLSKLQLFAIGLLLGYLSLISEHLFVLIIAAWSIWKFVCTLQQGTAEGWKKTFFSLLFVLFPALFLALMQGGVITDMLLHGARHILPSSFEMRSAPGVPGFLGFQPLTMLSGWIFLFLEWGIPLILSPLILYFLYKWSKIEKFYLFILIFVLISIPIPFFIKFSDDQDIIRISFLGYVLLSSVLGIIIMKFIHREGVFTSRFRKIISILFISLLTFSPIMFNVRILPMGIIIRRPLYSDTDYKIAGDVKKIIPKNARVFAINYMKVGMLWGVATPALGDYPIWNFDPQFIKEHFSFENLKKKSVTHVYFDSEMQHLLKISSEDFIKNGWEKLYQYHDETGEYIIYRLQSSI